METYNLYRKIKTEKQTIGYLQVKDNRFYTLELPFKDNQRNISCIPAGEYMVEKRQSVKYGDHFHILDVPDRSYILIHCGNFYTDIRGCILVGTELGDINADAEVDVLYSKEAMKQLNQMLPNNFKLKIIEQWEKETNKE